MLAVSASTAAVTPTTVWTGNTDLLTDWQTGITIPAAQWTGLADGDAINVDYEAYWGNENWWQLQFNDADGNLLVYSRDNGGQYNTHDVSQGTGTFSVQFTPADIATIKAKGMMIKGHALKVKKVSYQTAPPAPQDTSSPDNPTIWQDSIHADWSDKILIPAYMLSRLTTQSTLTLKYKLDGSSWYDIYIAAKDPYEQRALTSDEKGSSRATVTGLSSSFVTSAKKSGMIIKGSNFTLTKVMLTNPGDPEIIIPATNPVDPNKPLDPNDLGKLWVGEATFGDWDEDVYVEIPGQRLQDVDANTEFTLKYEIDPTFNKKDVNNWWQLQLGDGHWTQLEYNTVYGNSYGCLELRDGTSTYKFQLSDADIDLIKASALRLKGHGVILKSVRRDQRQPRQPLPSGGFYIDGDNHALLDVNGNPFVMRGINYSYAWQNGGEQGVIPAAARYGCNCLRINISDGGRGDGSRNQLQWKVLNAQELEHIIEMCEDNKIIAVFNTQNETGVDTYSELLNAVNYWIEMKDVLNRHKSTVIVNVSNEWFGTWQGQGWCDGYVKAIPLLREAGIANTLMIDCAGYGQYPQSLFDYGEDVLAADPDHNIIFSIHMYEDAAKTDEMVASHIVNALKIPAPLCIGEFGSTRQGNKIAYQKIMDECQDKGIGYIAWSWTGNGGSENDLDMFADYDGNQMLTNGENIINGRNGIRETSKLCTVYTQTSGIQALDATDNGTDGFVDPSHTPVEYFDLQGRRVDHPTSGLYIRRQGSSVVKVCF